MNERRQAFCAGLEPAALPCERGALLRRLLNFILLQLSFFRNDILGPLQFNIFTK